MALGAEKRYPARGRGSSGRTVYQVEMAEGMKRPAINRITTATTPITVSGTMKLFSSSNKLLFIFSFPAPGIPTAIADFEGDGQFVLSKPVQEEDLERVLDSLNPPRQAARLA